MRHILIAEELKLHVHMTLISLSNECRFAQRECARLMAAVISNRIIVRENKTAKHQMQQTISIRIGLN